MSAEKEHGIFIPCWWNTGYYYKGREMAEVVHMEKQQNKIFPNEDWYTMTLVNPTSKKGFTKMSYCPAREGEPITLEKLTGPKN